MVFVKQMIVFANLNDAPNWALVVFAELSWVRVSCVIPHPTYHISIGVVCLSHINLVLHPLRYHRLESDMSFRTHSFIDPFRVEIISGSKMIGPLWMFRNKAELGLFCQSTFTTTH